MMSWRDMRETCCGYLSALSARTHFVAVKKRWGQCTDEQRLWKTVTSAERIDAAFEAKRWAGQTRLFLRSESERKNSQRASVPFTLRLLQKCSDSPSGCVRQRRNDVKQSKQLRWSLCLCERECGNARKDSHVVNRPCLSRSYLSLHAASARVSSFTSPSRPISQRHESGMEQSHWIFLFPLNKRQNVHERTSGPPPYAAFWEQIPFGIYGCQQSLI